MYPGVCNSADINKNAICYQSVTVAPIKSLAINLLLVENLRAPRVRSRPIALRPVASFSRADVTIADRSAARRKPETIDRRLKWLCEHAICHAEHTTHGLRDFITYC